MNLIQNYLLDWACGGQWNRALQFVQLLATAFNAAHIEVIAFFDGTLKENKRLLNERNDFRQKAISVIRHIRIIGTPPPKVWWLPPSGIRTCLRNALRTVNIQVVQTVHDHTMELIDYFHENYLHAIIGLHPDYLITQVSRYFSCHDLRLSYKGQLETKEFFPSKLLATLQLNREQISILAALLGGYVLLDENSLKEIYKKINVEYSTDFESRIKQLANVIRSAPHSIDELIKTLNIEEFSSQLKESIEYYQRKGVFNGKKYLGNKKKAIITDKASCSKIKTATPLASETNENDEVTKRLLNDAIDDQELLTNISTEDKKANEKHKKKSVKFVYTLPAEVIRTAAERHKKGIMDPRVYILLIKKEILMPQVLEDEQYRELPAVHLFYRPARQMIYAILFNLYHQRYMHQKSGHVLDHSVENGKPEVIINEWVWSAKNDYKISDKITATHINWAVPTVQRLWFGTTQEDKQRRIKAFLTILRSDSPLMLNKNYVPQHLLVLASVLRYIVSNSSQPIINSLELDAFIATAFSPQLSNVEYTQEMVLPSVNLRGVYLATLFMQGVETAQLANDACGAPVPWSMTNPWLFFDGKLFQIKLKMSSFVSTLRELCDDLVDVMLKVDKFKKAILEDIEHMLPLTHVDSILGQGLFNTPNTNGFSSISSQLYNNLGLQRMDSNFLNLEGRNRQIKPTQLNIPFQNKKTISSDYQLKVGGVVVGSWAQGPANRNPVNSGYVKYPINKYHWQKGSTVTIQAPGNPGCYRTIQNRVKGANLIKPSRKLRSKQPNRKKTIKVESKTGDDSKPIKVEKRPVLKLNDETEKLANNIEKIDLNSDKKSNK